VRSPSPLPKGHSFILPLPLPGGRGVKPRSGPLSRGKVRLEQVGYWAYLPASNRQLSIRYCAKKLCSLASACCDLRGFVQEGFDIGAYGYLVDGFRANSRKILILMQQKDAFAG
jgi:hypothetical protein